MDTRVIYKGKQLGFSEEEVELINSFGAFAFRKGFNVGCFIGGGAVLTGLIIFKFFV